MFKCVGCGISMEYRKNTSNKYCSNKCQGDYQGNNKVKDWLSGKIEPTKSIVSRYLRQTSGYSCAICKISEWNNSEITLEIDHIDGDPLNNHHENFRYVCPNCHSQTSSYKGRNRGKGRPKARKNYTI